MTTPALAIPPTRPVGLLTAEHLHPLAATDGASWAGLASGLAAPANPDPDPKVVVWAYVNHGRWVGDCRCGSAQVLCRDDRRYWCPECRPPRFAVVTWPKNHQALEKALIERPAPETRNWRPGEPLANLRRENAAHGLSEGPADPARMQSALDLHPGD